MKKHIKQEHPEQGKPARAPRSDKGQRRLIERDLDILRLIGEQYAYRFDQLQVTLTRFSEVPKQKRWAKEIRKTCIKKENIK